MTGYNNNQSEENLRQNKERYHTILDTIIDGYYEVDLKGNFVFFNKQMCELTGYSESELRGMNYKEYLDETTAQQVYHVFNEVYTTEKPSKLFNYTAIRKDRTTEYVEISVALIKNKEGEKVGFRGIVRDITERKIAEEILKKSEEELKKRNEIIERDLATARLIQKAFLSNKVPKIPELLIEYKYLPLDAVGGDYFSFTSLMEGGFGVFIGDVSNHGLTAALFFSLIKATTDRICRNHAHEPKRYLENLNKELIGNMPMSFLTCVYGVFQFDYANNTMFTFSKAGHIPPLCYQAASRTLMQLKSKGRLIGMFEDIQNNQMNIALEKGDRIFLYTDGLPETINKKGELLGFDHFIEIIRKKNSNSLTETLDSVINEVHLFQGTIPFHDDVVLIGIEVQ